ncbi:DUF4178 domain-containing protein [Hymenobacter rubripertinctus]|uniref:DUF4178 domain-containing protein n=1 Tax=Hymenobacter rubripertinctus TaxID=2029981 RepID=A0A418QQ65_9BACT|nr:DUF4178 domain-containing protein [Hymenobacter rubripertinctus]RIY07369.1 DUF4178 domain-containing protein [Hymenobacter rubripertinctus]
MSQPVQFAPAAIRCPHCGHEVRYYDALQSAFFGCPACKTFFEYPEQGAPKQLRRFKDSPPPTIPLAVGSTGQLDSETYRITGYQWRCEAKGQSYRWEEFQLRHETTGANRQLAVFRGHWLLIEPTAEQYRASQGGLIEAEETDFQLYNRYSPRVLYAEGEFDWNVLSDESLTFSEYVGPPLMLVRERQNKNRDHWFLARHLEPAEVAEAFGVPRSQLPHRAGVGAAQPVPGFSKWPQLRTLALVMALVVVVTHVLLMLWGNETVFNREFVTEPLPTQPVTDSLGQLVTPNGPERQVLVSPSFAVPGTGALTVKLWASVDNSWVELPFALVNEQTGQQFAASSSLEYYHGVADGESWHEGNLNAETLLSQVPAGPYHLNFYPVADLSKPEAIQFRATVQARATAGSNAGLALLLLLLYPGMLYVRQILHESTRWENSDFSPS